jgi:predicted ATPase
MKIKSVKWNNHPVLGNLQIDFTHPLTGQPSDTIVLAGENGTGKTSILEALGNFLNSGPFEPFEYIEYYVGQNIYKAVPNSDHNGHKPFYDIIDSTGQLIKIRADKNNNPQLIESNAIDIRHSGFVLSKARADYKTQQITSTTTKDLDVDKYDNDSNDDFTSLKQLLVDIQNQDNSTYAELNQSLGALPKPWSEFYPSSKIFRFKNAFDQFFDKIKYEKVVDRGNEKAIMFKKNGKAISIDNLSTGEKQIVFRGSYLLRNSKRLGGATIMIDEPELSMHPKWQKKILKYYKDLFTEGGTQNAQLLIATHSESVLEDALLDKRNNLVVVLTETEGSISVRRIDAPSVLPTITSAETNYLAFDIVSNDYHIELYGSLQTKESRATVKSCDDFIKDHALYNSAIHRKPSSFNLTTYETLSTYIRNAIDHPDPSKTFSEVELRRSTELLIELCR